MTGNLMKRFGAATSVNDLMDMPNLRRSAGADEKGAPRKEKAKPTEGEVQDEVPVFKSKRVTAGIRIHPEVKEAVTKNAELSDLASRLLTEHCVKMGWL